MEVQLKELIEKIKNDGVESAKAQGEEIVAKARQEAKEIVAQAQKAAKEAQETAAKEAQASEERGRQALQQAGRDLLLNLTQKITGLFDAALAKHTREALDEGALTALVKEAFSKLELKGQNLALHLSEADAQKIGEALKAALGSSVKGGLEIKPTKSVEAGFRIEEKEGGAFYDFSSQALAENLAAYLNPKLAEDLKKAASLK